MKMKNSHIKKFEDHIIEYPDNNLLKFGEYRKGSSEFGEFIQKLMMFLRTFKKENEDILVFKTKNINFDLEKLYKLINDENKTRLISFNVKFTDKDGNDVEKPDIDGNIIFYDLNRKEDRPWEKNTYE